jgi:predicted ATP-dependent endonuclease of OLD family
MPERSKLVKMKIANLGCIGPEGLIVELDKLLCLVGPNNTGKSSVLRAYELAVGGEAFSKEQDLCKRANGQPATVEIWVHIPQGTANIAEKWKVGENGLLLVRSKWVWSEESNWKRQRYTWDPEVNDYAEDDKASGLDTVFSSRLPKPFRIGTLDDPAQEHQKLLTLVLQPISDVLQSLLADKQSELSKALETCSELLKKPIITEKEKLKSIETDINKSHGRIFPNLAVSFNIDVGDLKIDPIGKLRETSSVQFKDWGDDVCWSQQGTGSQRALFWAMLQVRSKLKALADMENQTKKQISECEKRIEKLGKELETVVKEETKQKRKDEITSLEQQLEQLKGCSAKTLLDQQSSQLSLPGYMLLIDEPEIALHPSAIRAASNYLYDLAEDPSWQVMLATHSPLFINPLQDHTTIVRLSRSATSPTPNTFHVDDVSFSSNKDEEKRARENLKMLNRFDTGLSEMFFGQRPILIEGDTEFAAFETVMNMYPDKYPAGERPVLVRARGKYTLRLLVKILTHFKVPFSILCDSDSPVRKDGKKSGAWTANLDICSCIQEARQKGVRVTHRISIPNFEFEHMPIEKDKDGFVKETPSEEKPWRIVQAISLDSTVRDSVVKVLDELINSESREVPFDGDFEEALKKLVVKWAQNNSPGDPSYVFDST